MNMLTVNNLSYGYPASFFGGSREAVHSVTFDIKAGEAFGFLGHNGAGKTTTIKCILGLVKRFSGTISINGTDSRSPAARAFVGYVPEQPYFYDHLTVNEAVRMYARLAGLSKYESPARVSAVLTRLGIADRSTSRMRSLSKGLTQRVAMAQAIVADPKLLILDEPFSGLDPLGRREFRELILDLKRNGTTIMMSSHVLSDVERICDRASILVRGALKGVFDLRNLPQLASTTFELVVGAAGDRLNPIEALAMQTWHEAGASRLVFETRATAEEALKKSLERGLEVVSFTKNGGTLEDVFTTIVTGKADEA